MTRRTRTKTRKPKFLSLRRQLAPPEPPDMEAASDCHHQLSLFPLHPTTDSLLLIQDPDPNVACLLEPPDDADAGGATITAILGGGSDEGSAATQEPPSPTSSSMNWEGDGDGLARRALRGRERWVFCCSSASSPSSTSEDVASSGGGGYDLRFGAPQALSLKLDYEEILTAWSDRGPLYVDGGGPQVVPELHDATMFVEVGSTWRVPEEAGGKAAEAVESREARVMRYKEKRRSRLFDKRIRYVVRKLNAEKRPRMKGRFVKKIGDA